MEKSVEQIVAVMNGSIGSEITSRKINDLEVIAFNDLVKFLIDGLTILRKEKYSMMTIKREKSLKSISLFLKTFDPMFLQSDSDVTIIAKANNLDYIAYAKEKSFSLFGIALNEFLKQRPVKYFELENSDQIKIYDFSINKISSEFETSFKEVSFLINALINVRIANTGLSIDEAIEIVLGNLSAVEKENKLSK